MAGRTQDHDGPSDKANHNEIWPATVCGLPRAGRSPAVTATGKLVPGGRYGAAALSEAAS
jgi:hypothetical protein